MPVLNAARGCECVQFSVADCLTALWPSHYFPDPCWSGEWSADGIGWDLYDFRGVKRLKACWFVMSVMICWHMLTCVTLSQFFSVSRFGTGVLCRGFERLQLRTAMAGGTVARLHWRSPSVLPCCRGGLRYARYARYAVNWSECVWIILRKPASWLVAVCERSENRGVWGGLVAERERNLAVPLCWARENGAFCGIMYH